MLRQRCSPTSLLCRLNGNAFSVRWGIGPDIHFCGWCLEA